MMKKVKRIIRKMIQLGYLFAFMLTSLGIAGNSDLGIDTPIKIKIIWAISGLLCVSKCVYCGLKYPNKTQYWD